MMSSVETSTLTLDARLLSGRDLARAIEEHTTATVRALAADGVTPRLAVVYRGEHPDAASYRRGIMHRARQAGIDVRGVALDEGASLASLREIILALNADVAVHAVLVQNPLPLNQRRLVGQILTPNKDVEGLTATHLGWLMLDEAPVPPCTPAAILALIESRISDLAGKRVVIINNSATIGRPLSQLLLNRRATVTVCSDATIDLPSETRRADILVVAIGQPRAIGAAHVGEGALVIDVGINPDPEGQGVCGDVDTGAVLPIVSAVTPVPGGVGPVTTAVLLENTAKLARHYGGQQEHPW